MFRQLISVIASPSTEGRGNLWKFLHFVQDKAWGLRPSQWQNKQSLRRVQDGHAVAVDAKGGQRFIIKKKVPVPSEGTFALSTVSKSQRRQITERHVLFSVRPSY